METKESTTFKALIFPWLAHGHIYPFLELAKKLAKKNFHIYFCSTAINLKSIQESLKENSSDFSMEFVDLHLPDMPELPPHHHTTKGLPPNLVSLLLRAFQMSRTRFSDIVKSVNPDLLIYDGYQPWAAEIAAFHEVPAVHFCTAGAATMSFFYHLNKYGGFQGSPGYPFQEIFLRDYEMKKLIAMANSDPKSADQGGHVAFNSFKLSREIVLIKSCREIEGKYLDYLSSLTGKKMVPVGPLVQETTYVEEDHLHIFNWLDTKNPSSVVFVSFGSECFPSKEEMEEIAHGLELSKVNFIWVIRFPAGTTKTVAEAVPEGFLERTKDRGIVVERWSPQTKILKHPSTGGFVSHCGWSSLTETLYYGVPLIAMPMKYDQFSNCRIMVEIGVGMEVLREENGELRREEIAKVIEEIVVKETGEDLKRKARELSEKLRWEEEGLIDEAIDKLQMICYKKM